MTGNFFYFKIKRFTFMKYSAIKYADDKIDLILKHI